MDCERGYGYGTVSGSESGGGMAEDGEDLRGT